jgi:hypothetical protein
VNRVRRLSMLPDLVLCLNEVRDGHVMKLQVALEVNLDLVQATERGGSRKPKNP